MNRGRSPASSSSSRSSSSSGSTLDSLVTRLVLVANAVSLFLLNYALLGAEWSVGVAVHGGSARQAFVGLSSVRLVSADPRYVPEYASLHDLCVQNYSRPITVPLGGISQLELLETPHDTWCAFESAGASAGSLLGMAWLPALLALGATLVYELQGKVASFDKIVSRAKGLGLTAKRFNYFALFVWFLLWLLLVLALTAFASLTPGSIGIGPAVFGDSFGLVRAMVLLTSVCGMGFTAHTLELWDVKELVEMLQEVSESRALKRILYVLIFAQLALYGLVALVSIDMAFLVCALGLLYLDTKEVNMLVAYVVLTVATLPLDTVLLCTLGHPASFLQWIRSTSYTLIIVCKIVSLGGMLMLHTKVKFGVKLSSEPQEELFGDADKPTARGEYSA